MLTFQESPLARCGTAALAAAARAGTWAAWAALVLAAVTGTVGAVLAVLLARAVCRIPPRPALWVIAFGCWPAYRLVFDHWPHEIIAGTFTSGACLAALAYLRTRQQRQFCATGGRAFNPRPGPARSMAPVEERTPLSEAARRAKQNVAARYKRTYAELAAAMGEVTAVQEQQGETLSDYGERLTALEAQMAAVRPVVRQAYVNDGRMPVPAALESDTEPFPALRVIRGGQAG